MSFSELLLAEPILRAVVSEGYTVATPVQAQAIPHILAGRDLLGCAQTGTGKTAAFALPILHRLSIVAKPGGIPRPRCLVLCPTRELATQISDSFRTYGKHLGLRSTVIFGGVGSRPQADALRRGVDIIIATPGRLLDLMGQGCCDLRSVEVLVLDEADRMLDMGFIQDIRKIVGRLPAKRQSLLFSATLPPDIRQLAGTILRDPVTVKIASESPSAERIEQCVYLVDRTNKPILLAHLVNELPMSRAIVFTRTKHGADRLVRRLHNSGIKSEAIHGNKSQNARERAMDNFRKGKIPLLIATDVASRGIDVDGISHVVNYDITDEPHTYVHRIGRTARAGASGMAISLCDHEEASDLRAIEKLIGRKLPVRTDHPDYSRMQIAPMLETRLVTRHDQGARQHQNSQHQNGQHQNVPPQHSPRQDRPRPNHPQQNKPSPNQHVPNAPRPAVAAHTPHSPRPMQHVNHTQHPVRQMTGGAPIFRRVPAPANAGPIGHKSRDQRRAQGRGIAGAKFQGK